MQHLRTILFAINLVYFTIGLEFSQLTYRKNRIVLHYIFIRAQHTIHQFIVDIVSVHQAHHRHNQKYTADRLQSPYGAYSLNPVPCAMSK